MSAFSASSVVFFRSSFVYSAFHEDHHECDEKQKALDEQKQNLDKFSKHHTRELEKAKKREADEIEFAERLEKELAELTEVEKQLDEKNEKLRDELEELQPYADYLQSVVEFSPQFESIEMILDRQQSLVQTRNEYVEKYQTLLQRYGTEEEQLGAELEKQKSKLIGHTMLLNEGKAKAIQTEKLNQYNKTTLFKDVQRIEDKKRELVQIKTAIKTIYNRAVEKSVGHVARTAKSNKNTNEEGMLKFIENRFNDLYDILHDPHVKHVQNPAQQNAQNV